MQAATRLWIALLALGLGAGCIVVSPRESRGPDKVVIKPGPPPHAPAHGHRHKFERDSVDLVFDSGLGVYVVVDLVDVFFQDGRYYRCEEGNWWVSPRPRDGWVVLKVTELPNGLRTYKVKQKGPGKAKGKGKKH